MAQGNARGKSAHDARLVAEMKVNGLEGILTFNEEHSARQSGVTVLVPGRVARTSEPEQ